MNFPVGPNSAGMSDTTWNVTKVQGRIQIKLGLMLQQWRRVD